MTKRSYTILITTLIFFLFVISSLLAEPAKLSRIEPPDDLDIILTGNDIELNWNTIPGATYYNIFRCGSVNGTYSIIDTTIDTSYVDTDAGLESKYFYYVTAVIDDGIEWINIPAGTYTSGPGDTVKTIGYSYEIMKYGVTNQQYVDYLNEAYDEGDVWFYDGEVYGYYPGDDRIDPGDYIFYDKGSPSYGFNYGRIDWTGSHFKVKVPDDWEEGDFDDHPVVDVSWFGAWAFAQYHGWDLPTWPELEKAARGMTGYDYPWGDTFDSTNANYNYSNDPFEQGTTPVGMYNGQTFLGFQTTNSPSHYGLYDMAGNVNQWTNTLHYPNQGPSFPARTMSQSSWGSINPVCWDNIGSNPPYCDYQLGFRCVK